MRIHQFLTDKILAQPHCFTNWYYCKDCRYVRLLSLRHTAGSGTTGAACKNLNRNFILTEQDEKYCEVIKNRVGCNIIKPGRFYSTTGIDNDIKQQEEDNIKLNKELDIKNEINILGKCPNCGGKLVNTKYGKTCEDCLTDY